VSDIEVLTLISTNISDLIAIRSENLSQGFFGSKILYKYPINAKINRLD